MTCSYLSNSDSARHLARPRYRRRMPAPVNRTLQLPRTKTPPLYRANLSVPDPIPDEPPFFPERKEPCWHHRARGDKCELSTLPWQSASGRGGRHTRRHDDGDCTRSPHTRRDEVRRRHLHWCLMPQERSKCCQEYLLSQERRRPSMPNRQVLLPGAYRARLSDGNRSCPQSTLLSIRYFPPRSGPATNSLKYERLCG